MYTVALMVGCWLLGNRTARATSPPQALRDSLLMKDPKGAHISEAYRYFTEPFGVPADPEQAEA